jgi:hypothetical protein
VEVQWTPHGWDRLRRLPWLTQVDVESAIQMPDQRFPVNDMEGRWIAHKLIDYRDMQYLLRVIYDVEEDNIAVVTSIYHTSRIARYWRTDL